MPDDSEATSLLRLFFRLLTTLKKVVKVEKQALCVEYLVSHQNVSLPASRAERAPEPSFSSSSFPRVFPLDASF